MLGPGDLGALLTPHQAACLSLVMVISNPLEADERAAGCGAACVLGSVPSCL